MTDKPTGGFLPIYICDKKEKLKEQEIHKKRGVTKPLTTLSIKNIIKERRKVTPFISLT